MGNPKAIIAIALAFLVASGTSFFLYRWYQSQTPQVSQSSSIPEAKPKIRMKNGAELVSVAVAAVDLTWGQKLNPELVKTVLYLKEGLPSGYFSDLESLKDRVVIAPVKQHEPIMEHRLAPTSVDTGGVSAVVTPGKRAIAVKGDKVIGLSGFILPANRVDVLVTMKAPGKKGLVTKTILENLLVLATGTEIQENEKGDPAPVDVYTLEVTPEEGERLALAAVAGKLQLALRNPIDGETVLTDGTTIAKTLASFRYPATKNTEKPAGAKRIKKRRTKKRTFIVEIIKGDKVSKKRF